jgi:hypothetical protein
MVISVVLHLEEDINSEIVIEAVTGSIPNAYLKTESIQNGIRTIIIQMSIPPHRSNRY